MKQPVLLIWLSAPTLVLSFSSIRVSLRGQSVLNIPQIYNVSQTFFIVAFLFTKRLFVLPPEKIRNYF